MTENNIYCLKLQKKAVAMDKPPFPGDLGQKIFESISQEARLLWMAQQTMLINEHRLNLIDPKSRSFLMSEMKKFLFEGDETKPTGYVAPKDTGA